VLANQPRSFESKPMAFLEMRGITKHFPGVVANADVNLSVERGEIHALVGENGAGKSTLMKILYGMEQPDAGSIYLDGQRVEIPNPHSAIRLGIGMVHQHFQLIPSLTVAENVALGFEPRRGLFVQREQVVQRAAELAEVFGLRVDPQAKVADLSVGARQRVEILKLLYRDARLLILDEPSAVLTPQEVEGLFEVIGRLVSEGRTTIFITHKLPEIMAICNRATVLRRGRVVGTINVAETTPEQIARMMVGAEVETVALSEASHPGEARLTMRGVSVNDDRGLPALHAVDLTVHAGEIVGVAGVEGSGQHELLEVLVGLRRVKAGGLAIGAVDCTRLNGRARRELGLALIPEDRNEEGLSRDLTIWENLIATRYHLPPQSRYGVLNVKAIKAWAADLMRAFDVRAPDPTVHVKTLSGGNAQKVVIARELATEPVVVIAAQPTRGLDVGAAQFVHRQMLTLRARGVGLLLISADLDELLAISDRLVVLYAGRVTAELDARSATREQLGLLMAGRSPQEVLSL
jgi:ABC-type uncharacterized transport system ATPase subunit